MTTQRHIIPPCAVSEFDFLDVNETSPNLPAAREACKGCHRLLDCRREALATDTSGFAGGMTETERTRWQERRGITPETLDVLDVTPAWEITPGIADILPVTGAELHSSVRDLILRMTTAGMPGELIAERLQHPQVTPETVDYIRRTYMRGYAKTDWSH